MHGTDLSVEAKSVLADYIHGNLTASAAAWILWHERLTPVPDPSASEVIVWSKQCGFGIPQPSEKEVQEQVKRCLENLGRD
jgi:hypothetical protein